MVTPRTKVALCCFSDWDITQAASLVKKSRSFADSVVSLRLCIDDEANCEGGMASLCEAVARCTSLEHLTLEGNIDLSVFSAIISCRVLPNGLPGLRCMALTGTRELHAQELLRLLRRAPNLRHCITLPASPRLTLTDASSANFTAASSPILTVPITHFDSLVIQAENIPVMLPLLLARVWTARALTLYPDFHPAGTNLFASTVWDGRPTHLKISELHVSFRTRIHPALASFVANLCVGSQRALRSLVLTFSLVDGDGCAMLERILASPGCRLRALELRLEWCLPGTSDLFDIIALLSRLPDGLCALRSLRICLSRRSWDRDDTDHRFGDLVRLCQRRNIAFCLAWFDS